MLRDGFFNRCFDVGAAHMSHKTITMVGTSVARTHFITTFSPMPNAQ